MGTGRFAPDLDPWTRARRTIIGSISISQKPRYEPVVEAGVVEAAGVLLLLSLEVEAGLLSFAPLPDSDLESDLESDLAVLSDPELSPDELLSDELLFEA